MRVSTVAWVPEYAGNDESWRVYRTASVTYKKRRRYEAQAHLS